MWFLKYYRSQTVTSGCVARKEIPGGKININHQMLWFSQHLCVCVHIYIYIYIYMYGTLLRNISGWFIIVHYPENNSFRRRILTIQRRHDVRSPQSLQRICRNVNRPGHSLTQKVTLWSQFIQIYQIYGRFRPVIPSPHYKAPPFGGFQRCENPRAERGILLTTHLSGNGISPVIDHTWWLVIMKIFPSTVISLIIFIYNW